MGIMRSEHAMTDRSDTERLDWISANHSIKGGDLTITAGNLCMIIDLRTYVDSLMDKADAARIKEAADILAQRGPNAISRMVALGYTWNDNDKQWWKEPVKDTNQVKDTTESIISDTNQASISASSFANVTKYPGYLRCRTWVINSNQPGAVPRTCVTCGKGPCHYSIDLLPQS